MKTLVLIFILSFAVSSYAQFAGGSGTADDPYLIETAEQLDNVRNYLVSHFIQIADIDLSDYTAFAGWEPIGEYIPNLTIPFLGSYDGNDYTISNLTISREGSDNIGLFGYVEDAVLMNISIESADISGNDNVGILIGWAEDSEITLCFTDGEVEGNEKVGGIVGKNSSMISKSYSNSTVIGTKRVGGLAGYNYFGEINNSYATGLVIGDQRVGGLIGQNWFGDIYNSYSIGEVTEDDNFTGGLLGKVEQGDLSRFNSFTHIEESENVEIMLFRGGDHLYGPVHSNNDIWIGGMGAGSTEEWPTFYSKVTTHGIFRDRFGGDLFNSGAPIEQIFQGGYELGNYEDYYIDLTETAQAIRDNGIHLIDGLDTDILYVKIDGESYTSWKAEIVLDEIKEFPVYSWFPMNADQAQAVINIGGNWFEDADIVATNEVAIYDTIWTAGPSGSLNNQSAWVDCKLWIEGVVEGMQVWGAADTIRIVGDITYANTVPGEAPDDPDNPNNTDYFGLVSESKILIAYKHWDPGLEMRRDDNTNDIYLYGAYAALGKGDPLIHGDLYYKHDGIITPEYQHPHGSTPSFWGPSPYTGNDTLYVWPDLHKYVFPEDTSLPNNLQGFNIHGANPPAGYSACGYPYESSEYVSSYPNDNPDEYHYPYGTDYPWYNPVWPESQDEISFNRGTINLYGSMIQRRRGYVLRSGTDPYNHPPGQTGVWDIDNFIYDGTHATTGYYKNYQYDNRLLESELVDFSIGEGNEIIYSYWDMDTSGQDSSAGGEGRSTLEMIYPYADNTYVDWDFDDIWAADENHNVNNGYPYLQDRTPPVSAEDETVIAQPAISIANYPNPFNPETTILLSLTSDDLEGKVSLAIYNIRGQRIRTLLHDEEVGERSYEIVWDGRNDHGKIVSSGTYFIRLETEKANKTHKIMMLK